MTATTLDVELTCRAALTRIRRGDESSARHLIKRLADIARGPKPDLTVPPVYHHQEIPA